LRMRNVGFTYPNTTRKIITGASIYCSLQSRVAVLGANGAGKSTMIKIVTGELTTDEGEITRHPNLRVAYVAQHAFHHLEQHLNQTLINIFNGVMLEERTKEFNVPPDKSAKRSRR